MLGLLFSSIHSFEIIDPPTSCSRLAFISAILCARLFLGLSVVLRSMVSATASNTDARAGSGSSSNPLSSESTTFCGLVEGEVTDNESSSFWDVVGDDTEDDGEGSRSGGSRKFTKASLPASHSTTI